MASQTTSVPNADATATPSVAAGTSLDAPIPQIVITEASPLNRVQTPLPVEENVAAAVSAEVPERAAVPVTSESTDTQKQTERQPEESNEQFMAAEDCVVERTCNVPVTECVVPVTESTEAPTPEVGPTPIAPEEIVARIERTGTEDDEFRAMDRGCHVCRRCRGFYYRMADSFNSVYSVPFWFTLLAIPLSAGFMGGKYMDGCPGRSTLPFLLFLLGIGGFIMLMGQLCYVIGTTVCREVDSCIKPFMAHIAYTAGVVTFMALLAETASFFTLKPNFNSLSPKFCHHTFYEYTRWMNYTIWLLTLLMVAIRLPVACIRFNRGGRARHVHEPVAPIIPVMME